MKRITNLLNLITYGLLRFLGGPAFSNRSLSAGTLFRCWFCQKILGINREATWPVHWTSVIRSPNRIRRGTRNPGISMGCYIDGRNGIEIGENTWIGPKVSIISMNHNVLDYNRYVQESPVIIGKNCWLGAHSVILPGVVLGDHTIVAAGAVVTKSFPEGNQILAGVPAKPVSKLADYGSLR